MQNILALLCLLGVSHAQTRIIGEVASKSATSIAVKTDAGETVSVDVSSDTKYLRVPPGETSLSKASEIKLDDVNTGDRVLARTGQIVVMSRSDLQQKQAAQAAEWQKRGTAGKVTAVSATELTVVTPARQTLQVETSPKTLFRRYAPESVRFSDAKPGVLADIKAGDQVRVLGDRNGDSVLAETVVSGSFRNFAGTVAAVNAATGEITLTDLETKKPILVRVNSDATARRLPPVMAQMLAQRVNANPNADSPTAAAETRARSQAGSGMAGPRDLGSMLERMPALNLAELKPGDALIVASTAGVDGSRVTAITLLAGVEPLLTGPPTDRRLSGPWSLDINMAP